MSLDVREKELKLTREAHAFIRASYSDLSSLLQIPEADRLLRNAGTDLAALKILLSLFRRLKELAKFQLEGKAEFTVGDSKDE